MPKRRAELHEKLCEFLGSSNVYFQPPKTVQMKYPCIVYGLSDIRTRHANDAVYAMNKRYEVTLITKDPDNNLTDEMAVVFPLCEFDRLFVSDNLYHYVYTLYY